MADFSGDLEFVGYSANANVLGLCDEFYRVVMQNENIVT